MGARQRDSERKEGLNPFAGGGSGVWSRSPVVGSCTDSDLGGSVEEDDGRAQETTTVVRPRRYGDVGGTAGPEREGRVEGFGARGEAREDIGGDDNVVGGDRAAMSTAVDALQKTGKARKSKKSKSRRERGAPILPRPSLTVPPLRLDSDSADTADTIADTSSDVDTNIGSGHVSSSSSSEDNNREATHGIPKPTVARATLRPADGTKSTSSLDKLQKLHSAGPPNYGSTSNNGESNARFYTSKKHTNYGSMDTVNNGSSDCWESGKIVVKDLENGADGIGHVESKAVEDDDGSSTGSDRFGMGGLGHALRMILRSRATLLLYAATSVRMVATWTLASYLAVSNTVEMGGILIDM